MDSTTTSTPAAAHMPAPAAPQLPKLIDFSEIIPNAWTFYKKNFRKMWALFLLGGIGALFSGEVVNAVLSLVRLIINSVTGQPFSAPILIFSIAAIVLFFVSLIAYIGLFKGIIDARKGQFVSLTDTYKKSVRLFWPFMLALLLLYAAVMGGVALFVIPGMILGGYLIFTQIIVVDKETKSFDTLLASWSLVKNYWWATLLRLLGSGIILSLVTLGVFVVSAIVFGGLAALFFFVFHLYAGAVACVALLVIAMICFALFVVFPLNIIVMMEMYESLNGVKSSAASEEANVVVWRKRKIIVAVIIGILAIAPLSFALNKAQDRAAMIQEQKMGMMNMNNGMTVSTSTVMSVPGVVQGLAATSTDLQSLPYASATGNFQVNLPLGWTYEEEPVDTTSGIAFAVSFLAPQGQESTLAVTKLDTAMVRQATSSATDAQIATEIASETIRVIKDGFSQSNFTGLQVSAVSKQTLGKDTGYVYTGSVKDSTSNDTIYFKMITVFNGNDGYQLLAIWPESEYGASGTVINEALGTFHVLGN